MNSKIFLGLLVIATLQKGYSQTKTAQTINVDIFGQFPGGYNIGSASYLLKFGPDGTGEQIGCNRARAGYNFNGLDFYTAGKKRLAITNGGFVGIGLNNGSYDWDPLYPLHVQGTIAIDGTGKLTSTTNLSFHANNDGIGTDGEFLFMNGSGAGTTRMRLTNEGKLGIGVYPSATLHVANTEMIEGNTAPFEPSPSVGTAGALNMGVTQGGPGSGSAWLQSRDGSPLLLNPVSSSTSGPNGNSVEYVGIGFPVAPASKVPGGYMLAVNGNIICTALKVKNYGNWSDFVFDKDYKLPALSEVETYINENKHLPGIPSAEEVKEDGFETAEMSAKLLQKIEELTLYMIEQQKESALIKKEIQVLKAENAALKNQITK